MTYAFVVPFEVLQQSLIEFLIGGLWAFDGAPVVADNLTVADQGSIPFGLLQFQIVFHGLDVAI